MDNQFRHKWHVAINAFNDGKMGSEEWCHWMYDAKDMSDEVRRMALLFKKERLGELTKIHRQCNMSPEQEIIDNHLTCCIGTECRKCPHLLALERIKDAVPEQIDEAKAWTCAAHIMGQSNKSLDKSEGWILTEDDKMFWQQTYESMSNYIADDT